MNEQDLKRMSPEALTDLAKLTPERLRNRIEARLQVLEAVASLQLSATVLSAPVESRPGTLRGILDALMEQCPLPTETQDAHWSVPVLFQGQVARLGDDVADVVSKARKSVLTNRRADEPRAHPRR